MSSSEVSLKLLVHKTSRKILFGQADKNFIDFLFTVLALPVSTIFNLVSTESTVGGPLRNLYHSVQNLDTNVFRALYHNFLLKPNVQIPRSLISSLSKLLPLESLLPPAFYSCSTSDCHGYYTDSTFGQCPGCQSSTTERMYFIPYSCNGDMLKELMTTEKIGFLKDKIPYMVMEDLTVKPMSAMNTISMLSLLGVNDISLVEEKLVYLDFKLCLDLLRAAIDSSSTVLSDVFLHNIDFEDS